MRMNEMRQFPAVKRLQEYAAGMAVPELAGFSEPIVDAWEKFRALAAGGQVAGARMALKDLYEVTLKTVVLTGAVGIYQDFENRTPERNHFLQVLFVKNPAFGYWKQEIGGTLQRLLKKERAAQVKQPEGLPEAGRILTDLLRTMEKFQIVAWRNQEAHGAAHDLQEEGAVVELAEKWEALAAHLARVGESYRALPFGRSDMYPFVMRHEEQWFFFDSFFREIEQISFLNYRTNRRLQAKIRGVQAFYERFQMQPAGEGLAYVESDELTDGEMAQLGREKRLSYLQRPDYLETWLKTQLTETSGGYLLLQMERGMGKTTFAQMLDPSGGTSVRPQIGEGITTRCYHMTPFYNRQSVVSFARELEYRFATERQDGQETRVFGGSSEGRIVASEDAGEMRASLAQFLNQMRRMHEKRFGREKLLLVLDGADEVMTEAQARTGVLQIPDILPEPTELEEGIYVLLLSRTDREMVPYRLWDRLVQSWRGGGYLLGRLFEKKNEPEWHQWRTEERTQDTLQPAAQVSYAVQDQGYRKVVSDYIRRLAYETLPQEELELFLQNGAWNFVFAAAAAEFIRLYGLSEPEELRAFFGSIRGLEDLYEKYMANLQFVYGTEYFRELQDVLLGLTIVPGGKRLSELAAERREGGITYRLVGMVQDLAPFVKEHRNGRESHYACANLMVRDLVLKRCPDAVADLCRRALEIWVERFEQGVAWTGETDVDPADVTEMEPMPGPEPEYLLRVPFSEALLSRVNEALYECNETALEGNYLPLLRIVNERYKEAGRENPRAMYLLQHEVERLSSQGDVKCILEKLQDMPAQRQEELLGYFWSGYETYLGRRCERACESVRYELDSPGEATVKREFYWDESERFFRMTEALAHTELVGHRVSRETLRQTGDVYADLEAYLWPEQPGTKIDFPEIFPHVRQMCGLQEIRSLEERLLYLCLGYSYLRFTEGKKSGAANQVEYWVQSGSACPKITTELYELYEQFPRETILWRDCLRWSLATWVDVRLMQVDACEYASYLAERAGKTLREFMEIVHEQVRSSSMLSPLVFDENVKSWVSSGNELKDKLFGCIEKNRSQLWVYLQIEQDYLRAFSKKQQGQLFAAQLAQILYGLQSKNDYENFLRCFRMFQEMWPEIGWLQRRNLNKKLELQKNLPVMVSNMAFCLANEENGDRRRSTTDVIYRSITWFGLPVETVEALIERYAKKTKVLNYRELAQAAMERPDVELEKLRCNMTDDPLRQALNRACCLQFWREQKEWVNEQSESWCTAWCHVLEMCGDDLDELLALLEPVMKMPTTFECWERQMQEEQVRWVQEGQEIKTDQVLCNAVTFRKKAAEWGEGRCLAVWGTYLGARLRQMGEWSYRTAPRFLIKKTEWMFRLKEEWMSRAGLSYGARQAEIQGMLRGLVAQQKGVAYDSLELRNLVALLYGMTTRSKEETPAMREACWEPELLFILYWYGSQWFGPDLDVERMTRLLPTLNAEKLAAYPEIRRMLNKVMIDLLEDTWNMELIETWIRGLVPVVMPHGVNASIRWAWKQAADAYLQPDGGIYSMIQWKMARWPGRDPEAEAYLSDWEWLKLRMKASRMIIELFRQTITEVAAERSAASILEKLEKPMDQMVSYEAAVRYMDRIDGAVRPWHVGKIVNEIRSTAAYLAAHGEMKKAKTLYEHMLVVCRSCESGFMWEDHDPRKEIIGYLSREPWQMMFRTSLVGYCMTVLEYLELEADEIKVYAAGSEALQHIVRVRKGASEGEKYYYGRVQIAYEPIVARLDRAAREIGAEDAWYAVKSQL